MMTWTQTSCRWHAPATRTRSARWSRRTATSARALLPDPGLAARRRGRPSGDAALGLAGPRGFRGALVGSTWLYRIATNRRLDAIRAGARRDEPVTPRINGLLPPTPTHRGEVPWLTPYPDDLLDLPDPSPGPEAVVESHEATSLAFVTALQLPPPKQRAVLILRDVLGYRAAEVADLLDGTVESVTSALKRARATLESDEALAERRTQPPAPAAGSPEERRLIEAYVDAFTTHDVDKLVAILSEDVWLKMPPLPLRYHGRDAAIGFFQAVVHLEPSSPAGPHAGQRLPCQRGVRPRPRDGDVARHRPGRGGLLRRPDRRASPVSRSASWRASGCRGSCPERTDGPRDSTGVYERNSAALTAVRAALLWFPSGCGGRRYGGGGCGRHSFRGAAARRRRLGWRSVHGQRGGAAASRALLRWFLRVVRVAVPAT